MSSILAMAAFSLAMSVSPGPVNMITLSIGVNSGFRRALPFVTGATIGFTLLLWLVGLGLGEAVESQPVLFDAMNFAGCAFLCYVGYKISVSGEKLTLKDSGVPGFWNGFLLQWLNPKAWAACLAGVALFVPGGAATALYSFVVIYFFICFIGVGSWAVFGDKVWQILDCPRALRMFNRGTGAVLVLAAVSMLLQ